MLACTRRSQTALPVWKRNGRIDRIIRKKHHVHPLYEICLSQGVESFPPYNHRKEMFAQEVRDAVPTLLVQPSHAKHIIERCYHCYPGLCPRLCDHTLQHEQTSRAKKKTYNPKRCKRPTCLFSKTTNKNKMKCGCKNLRCSCTIR
jgi:hypothetical protein